ncbi:phosphatase PAP2 family protein [Mesorhizobium sp. KR9-304]|uniref:phosphatase PAP2 family protein n=1 Tax=Mesorhizobium sp. KR9-304 TaxID=3156614 RepID=UPI0032B5F128
MRGATVAAGLFALYCSSAYILAGIYNFQIKYDLYNRVSYVGIIFPIMTLLLGMLYTLARERPDRPFNHLKKKIIDDWVVSEKIVYGFPHFVLIVVFFSFYSSIKSAISNIQPFYFDSYAANLDGMLHGVDPWRPLHAVFGGEISTWTIGVLYNLWVPVVFGTLAFVLFVLNNNHLRGRFVISFLLTWSLLGSFSAIVFSSVGPCYNERFFGDPRFAPLMAALDGIDRTLPLLTRSTQEYLYNAYQTAEPGLGTGISAFPSLHVASAMLVCLFAWNFGPFWKAAGILFVAAILVGSVHLGWHYAVDGYASIAAVSLIWLAVGRVLRPSANPNISIPDTLN